MEIEKQKKTLEYKIGDKGARAITDIMEIRCVRLQVWCLSIFLNFLFDYPFDFRIIISLHSKSWIWGRR